MEKWLERLAYAFVASGFVMITPTNFLYGTVYVPSWFDCHGCPSLYLLDLTKLCDILPIPPDMSIQDDSDWLVEVRGRAAGYASMSVRVSVGVHVDSC